MNTNRMMHKDHRTSNIVLESIQANRVSIKVPIWDKPGKLCERSVDTLYQMFILVIVLFYHCQSVVVVY